MPHVAYPEARHAKPSRRRIEVNAIRPGTSSDHQPWRVTGGFTPWSSLTRRISLAKKYLGHSCGRNEGFQDVIGFC